MAKSKEKTIGEVLDVLLKRMGLKLKVDQYRVIELWPEIVGEKIAKVARADRAQDQVLYVKVKSMAWRTELVFQKQKILRLISDKIGKNVITEIRFF
jgi:predicted nucleic acid-binding Zn ribbon protein